MSGSHSSINHLALNRRTERSRIMETFLDSPLQICLKKLLPFTFSFLDDALLLLLSRFGVHVHGLQWVSPIMLSGTLIYWAGRFLYDQYRTPPIPH